MEVSLEYVCLKCVCRRQRERKERSYVVSSPRVQSSGIKPSSWPKRKWGPERAAEQNNCAEIIRCKGDILLKRITFYKLTNSKQL